MPNSNRRRSIVVAAFMLAPLISPGAGSAKEAAAETPAAQATDVGEVVVTATRHAESLSKVAESVSAFTAKKMDIQGIKSFLEIAKFTTGVIFEEARHDISIRGIASTAGSGTTGIYIDDTPIQARALGLNANNTLPAVFDLDRVEVLRGPQGTLFGAGSEGGTVRYITPQPSLSRFSATAHVEGAYTQDGALSYEAGAAAGGPIIPGKLGFRLSAWGRRDGGYIDRYDYLTGKVTEANANRVDTVAVRGAITWSPFAQLLVTPGVAYQKRDQHNYDNYWVAASAAAGHLRSGTPDRQADPDRFYLPTLKIEYDLKSVKLISNTAYYNRRERVNGYSGTLYDLSYFQQLVGNSVDPQGVACANACSTLYPLLTPTGLNLPGLPRYVAQNLITNAQQNFTEEFRVQSANPDARLTWTAGVFYSSNRQRSTEVIIDPQLDTLSQLLWGETTLQAWGQDLLPGGIDYINDTKAKDRQTALFADVSFKITDRLKINGGVRYAWTHYEFLNLNDGPQDLLLNGGVPNINTGGKDERPFTPKGEVSYQLNRDDLIYASVAKGFRIGGATPPLPAAACGPGFPTSYDSDSVVSYEAGTKDRFLDRRLQVSASAFYIKWRNIQQAFIVPACGIQFTTNSGDAVSKGFDFQSQFNVSKALTLEMTLGYTNARFTKDASDANGDVLAKKGDWLNVVPWTVSLAAQYNFSVMSKPAFARVDYDFNSHRTGLTPNQDPATHFYDAGLRADPATHEVSFRAGVSLEKADLAFFVNNLLDSRPIVDLNHQDRATTLYEARTLRPRTVGLAATLRY